MAYKYFNPNPLKKSTDDCVIRAVSLVTGKTWDETYTAMCAKGYELKEMPSSNNVWRAFLSGQGFQRYWIPDTYPYSYTISEFANDNPKGKYLLFVGEHVVCVVDGNYYDTFDSGYEVPSFYWKQEN